MPLEIHPAVGIARIGAASSKQSDYFFFGPEPCLSEAAYQNGTKYDPADGRVRYGVDGTNELIGFRSNGSLKRQAVRFRIFDCDRDKDGTLKASQEIDYSQYVIDWTVRLGNRKGVAQQFDEDDDGGRRRRNVLDRDDSPLPPSAVVIAPDKCTLGGPNHELQSLTARFMNVARDIELAKVTTDASGRLVVIGPRGDSGSPYGLDPIKFADNDYWYDNTGDGPVLAHVRKKNPDGSTQDLGMAANAWVVIAPFDFAPDIDSFISLYDIAGEAWRQKNGLPLPDTTYYDTDVLPILERVRNYRWVNGPTIRAETQDRHTSWRSGKDPIRLEDPTDPVAKIYRNMLLAHLRRPDGTFTGARQVYMPRLHSANPYVLDSRRRVDVKASANEVLCLTQTQFRHLENWAAGKFIAKHDPVALEHSADALDRIALQACSGGAFYPGMEASSIMTNPDVYDAAAPFRIRPKLDAPDSPADPRQEVGHDSAGTLPGGITENLAVPWQSDFWQCQMERDNAWWPATRPDHVFIDEPMKPLDSQSEEVYRWDEGLKSERDMVESWTALGVVVRKPFRTTDGTPPKDLEMHDPRVTGEYDVATRRYYCYAEEGRDLNKLPHERPSCGELPNPPHHNT